MYVGFIRSNAFRKRKAEDKSRPEVLEEWKLD
ncbi:hypothetical protein [Acinetobacter phage Ab69]|nr:hypothetical protein [Acinetobacter phage Ab69]